MKVYYSQVLEAVHDTSGGVHWGSQVRVQAERVQAERVPQDPGQVPSLGSAGGALPGP